MAIEQGKHIEFHDIDTVYNATFLGLPYRGVMGNGEFPSKDFNDYIFNGVYNNGGTNDGFINAPHSADNGYLMVVGGGLHQFWFSEFQFLPVMYRHLTSRENNTWSDWSSGLRATRRTVTSGQWGYDSVLYLGIHSGENAIVSIKISGGYAVPTTILNDPMWYATLYDALGTKITSGTHTLEVTYIYKGIES